MTKFKSISRPFFTFALAIFMLSLAAMASPTLYMVQAQSVNQSIVSLDSCAANSFATATEIQSLDADQYIGNSNSGIFHYAWCRYVGKMSDAHKVYFDSRDGAIDAGYRPCKICRP
ncbi:MAG: Ada metal-binding domain-containing protein [Sporomusaceae bacterium]|nr:Ada metal-binding domain-containing protein [Sporomusaceae bacterium]